MWVGAARVSLRLRGINSLKAKRSVIARLKSQAQKHMQLSLAECAAQDSKDWAVLAAAWTAGDRDAHLRRANALSRWLEDEQGMQVVRLERFEQPMPSWTPCPVSTPQDDLPAHWLEE